MTYNFTFKDLDQCLPLSRKELLKDVVVDRLYGEISAIWHHPRHVFISTDNGRKLFTFDCSTVHPQNGFSNSSLDIHNSPSSILDVILISSSIAVVMERNGHSQWWRYTMDGDWVHVGNMELCTVVHASVEAVVFLPDSSTLVWCEKNENYGMKVSDVPVLLSDKSSSIYCIRAKSISLSDVAAQSLREQEVRSNITLIENCPACDVFAVGTNKIFIRTKVERDQITVSFVCSPDLSDAIIFIGHERFDTNESVAVGSSLDFRALLLKHLPTIIKMELNNGDLGVKQDDNRIVTLSSCGHIEVFTFTGKKKLDHLMVPISFEDSTIQDGSWFLHKQHIGIIYQQKICLYSIYDGTCVSKWTSDDIYDITRVIPSASPAFLAWTLKANGLMAIQATDSRMRTAYTSADNLPDNELLETAILQLSHLHQLKQGGSDKRVSDKLENMKQAWSAGRGSHQSQIADMIAPLLDEYWRLDDLSKVLLEKLELSQADPDKVSSDKFADELAKTVGLPRRAKESRLRWLSQIYPHQLLDSLTQGITLDCEEVIESELPKWQALLGIEGWDLSRFEPVCRLLYQYYPHKLYHFVKCAESVSEQTVGVSAFVRKKHSMIFYRSALECLPLAETSCHPAVAAAAHGSLIRAGGGSDNVERVLKHLLHHSLWQEAVDLVKGQSSNQEHLPSYLYILVTALVQNQTLSKYTPEILDLMPSWKSFLSFSQVTSCQSEIRQRQLSTSASDLFCHHDNSDQSDVSIGSVKPFLMKIINNMDGTR